MSEFRAALVPGALALLPEYAGLHDPLADLRAACREAVAWLGPDPVVLGDPQGIRVGRALLAAGDERPGAGGRAATSVSDERPSSPPHPTADGDRGRRTGVDVPTGAQAPDAVAARPPAPGYLVVGNGSACRSEKAPGHLDERAFAFDAGLRAALLAADATWADGGLGEELLASLAGIRELLPRLPAGCEAVMDYEDDPYGVQYWVMRWSCES